MQQFGTKILYQGYTLKSRVEFAWAQYFEGEGIDWEYEPLRFCAGRESYTPDFGLHRRALAAEIKVYGARNVLNKMELCPLPLLLIFGEPNRCYCHFKPAGAAAFLPRHFRTWHLAYDFARKALA